MSEAVLSWLLTYFLHSSLLLALAWTLDKAGLLRSPRLAEIVWRTALCAGLLTATLQAPLHDWLTQVADHQSLRTSTNTLSITEPGFATEQAMTTVQQHGADPLESPRHQSSAATAQAAASAIQPPTSSSGAGQVDIGPTQTHILMLPTELARIAPIVVIAWLVWVVFGWLKTLLAVRRLNASVKSCATPDDPELHRFIGRISARHGDDAIRVRLSECWDSPLVLPNNVICIPAWLGQRLTRSQREAVLAHEVAHILRRDPAWRIASQMIGQLVFFQPLHRLAAARLDMAAELACDDWAARACGQPRALAEALLTCAETIRMQQSDMPGLALAMTRKKSPLLMRISALMEEGPMFLKKPLRGAPVVAALAFAAAILTAGFVLPTVAVAFDLSDLKFTLSTTFSPNNQLNVKFDGSIVFNEDETDIVSVSRSAYISQKLDGKTIRMEFKPDGKTGVLRTYSVDGKNLPVDAQAQAWLAKILPIIVRESGWNIEERLARLQKKGGPALAVDEIERCESGYARSRYVQAYAAMNAWDAPTTQRVLGIVGKMKSDYERRQTYAAILKQQNLSGVQLVSWINGVATISSDYEKQQALTAVAPRISDDAQMVAAWEAAVKSMHSDYEAGNVVKALAQKSTLTSAQLQAALSATASIKSSYEHQQALARLAPHLRSAPAMVHAYLESVRSISSDYETQNALLALLQAAKLDKKGYAEMIDVASGMHSSYEIGRVLQAIAQVMPPDAELVRQYRQAAKKLGDYERGQAEKALDHLNV
jgi:beta-lactamase regulating signal transducer with metallopeptidase domain